MAERLWSVAEAREEIPRILVVGAEVIELRARIVEQAADQQSGSGVNLADLKADEARISELLDGLRSDGIQVKGFAPLLIDFPSVVDGREVLLCWLEGERSLEWYHDPDHGFAGRRRLEGS